MAAGGGAVTSSKVRTEGPPGPAAPTGGGTISSSVRSTGASAVMEGAPRVMGLVGANNSGTPNTQFDLSADYVVLRSPSDGSVITKVATGTLTNNISTAGPIANGRDQSAAFSASSWLHFYFICKADGTSLSTLSSTTAPPSGPALPATYTHWAYAGAVRYNATPVLVGTRMRGAWAFLDVIVPILTGGAASGPVSMVNTIPPNAVRINGLAELRANTGAAASESQGRIAYVSGLVSLQLTVGVNPGGVAGTIIASYFEIPNINQTLHYLVVPNSAGTTAVNVVLNIWIHGYAVPNGGE